MALDYKHLLNISDFTLRHNAWHGTKYEKMPGFFTPYQSLTEASICLLADPVVDSISAAVGVAYMINLTCHEIFKCIKNLFQGLLQESKSSLVMTGVFTALTIAAFVATTVAASVDMIKFLTRSGASVVNIISNSLSTDESLNESDETLGVNESFKNPLGIK